MKIKQTTFYALRAIRRIYVEDKPVITSTVIAEKEELSQGVLLRLLRTLNHAGILEVHQGRGTICGGFSLVKKIDEITLLEVIDVMEHIDICSHLGEEFQIKEKQLFNKCEQINKHLREELSKYTIRDLFEL